VYLFDNLEECFRRVRERYGRVLATLPAENSVSLYDLDLTQPTALLFGNEDDGISPEALALCDGAFVIPQAGFAESLNLSVACAVTLYEAARQRRAVGCYSDQPRLNAEQQEQLFERWKEMLKGGGHRNRGLVIDPSTPPLPPIFIQRADDAPIKRRQKPVPVTRFDL
jgi:tRNA (guanosine-2'-O-)-methyltransferase